MSYNLVDPTTGDLTRVAGNSNIVDSAIGINSTWSSKKINDSLADIESALDELENIPRLTDFDEAIPEKGKNKIYYVNKTIGTYGCAQWRVESMYYDVSGLNQYRGVQKVTSLNGVDNIMLMREYYSDSNNVMRWSAWGEIATMDKVNALHKQTVGYIEGDLLSSAIESANLYYQKFGDSKLVINGWISLSSEVPNDTKIFTLPNGWKTNSHYLVPCYASNSNSAYACVINIDTSDVKSYTPLPSGGELRFCGTIYLQ